MAILRKGALTTVIVHHSATTGGAKNITELKKRATSYSNTMKNRSWAEKTKTDGKYPYLSYHYMIARDGALLYSQNEKYTMYHASSFEANSHGIGVCLDGNYMNEKPTDTQKETLAKLIADKELRRSMTYSFLFQVTMMIRIFAVDFMCVVIVDG